MEIIKKISVIAVLLLLVGGIGSILTYNFNGELASVEQVIDHSAEIKDIDIRSKNERVELISTNDEKIKVVLEGRRALNLTDRLAVEVIGNQLSIQTKGKKKIFNINVFAESLKLTIYLPEQMYDSVHVEIKNGSFHAQQQNIKDIQASTVNGNIEMINMHATNVRVNSNNGNISLNNTEGNIMGKSNNGKLSLVTPNLDRSIELETNNGNITIQTKEEPTNAILDIKTTNGRATVFGSTNWNIKVGKGENLIKLTTKNGNVTVTK